MKDYSTERALALLKLAKCLKRWVSTPDKYNYIDKVSIVVTVSESYLNISQAFKVDDSLWKQAQKDVSLIETYVKDEQQINKAFILLFDHLNSYIESLGTWT